MKYQELLTQLNNNKENGKRDVYVISSVDGKGVHIGRIKGISQDSNGDIVIDTDIDKESVTREERE